MIIDCVGDLHGFYPKLDGGDLLIVAGDLTARDLENEMAIFDYWLHEQKYSAKIVIGGNHDNVLQQKRFKLQFGTYLEDSGTEFVLYPPINTMEEGKVYERPKVKIWGSPWTKTFPGMNPRCKAFTCDTEEELAEKWKLIPDDTDILITHSPPEGIFDEVPREDNVAEHCGSPSLRAHIMCRIKPKLHLFGHIHEHGGKFAGLFPTQFINCSYVNERYEPVNKPIRIVL